MKLLPNNLQQLLLDISGNDFGGKCSEIVKLLGQGIVNLPNNLKRL